MVDTDSQPSSGDEGLQGKSTRDKLFRIVWTYLRGFLLIVVVYLIARAIGEAYLRVEAGVEPFFRSFTSAVPNTVGALAILVLGPWALGRITELFLAGRLFQRQRGLRAYQQMERRLTTELKADSHHGYRVALVNFPNADNRSLGLIVAELEEPGTGRELAAVFLPKTPDPSKGSIQVVAIEDLQLTDWDLSDLFRFHITFGSACPDLSDIDE